MTTPTHPTYKGTDQPILIGDSARSEYLSEPGVVQQININDEGDLVATIRRSRESSTYYANEIVFLPPTYAITIEGITGPERERIEEVVSGRLTAGNSSEETVRYLFALVQRAEFVS